MSEFAVSLVRDSESSRILGVNIYFPSRFGFPAAPQDTNDKPFTKRDSQNNSVLDMDAYKKRNARSKRWLRTVDQIMAQREAAFDRASREPKVGKVSRVAVRAKVRANA